ncbi:hypothetical protein SmJEL517_g01662 [Synchytrium microbalum]|uniref:Fe2OG dioxygenase domain-containing protein n=1 Tax=Synchytrium microbalum TaxID=1806994 RepID=A0A507C5J1_9FUNG|nr:uncharacterized protein SmJEL517_g01662 [Synchytrium microbalum]TPX36267.1 hypothetical protein SmJEL517_g01662 [Synchytrium microbalum]
MSDPWDSIDTVKIAVVDWKLHSQNRELLKKQINDAARTLGFFVLINHPIDKNLIDGSFQLAKDVFAQPAAEKEKYEMGTTGNYFGYKAPRKMPGANNGDHNEMYNISKDLLRDPVAAQNQLRPLVDAYPKTKAFAEECHSLVCDILKICAEVLEIPKEAGGANYLLSRHRFEAKSGDQIRLLQYPPPPPEFEKNELLFAHTDYGSVTLLFTQSVGGLQICDPEDKQWRYVRPLDGSIIVNLGDAVQHWTKGYWRSNLHRVTAPPAFQRHMTRHSVVYFARPEDAVVLERIPSPFIPEDTVEEKQRKITAEEWIKARVLYGVTGQQQSYL